MNVFVTGASGYIGGSIAVALLAHGHSVRGLVRCAEKAQALARLGLEPVVGGLDDAALLAREAERCDAVLSAASSDHRPSIDTLLDALAGSGKPLLHTSGSSVIADDARGMSAAATAFDESTPLHVPPVKAARRDLDLAVQAAAQRGVRSVVLCNAMIYGAGHGLHTESAQVPTLVREARRTGAARVVGAGLNRWSNVHVDDVCALYLLALEKAPPGAFYFVENGEASFREIGEAIAARLGLGPVEPWPIEEAAAALGAVSAHYTYGSNSRVKAVRARDELGWAPRHRSVTHWIEHEMPLPA